MPALTGDINDPEFRRARARHAALARTTIDAHIAAIERRADELTDTEATRLYNVWDAVRSRRIRTRRSATPKTTLIQRTPNGIAMCEGQRTMDDQLRENGVRV